MDLMLALLKTGRLRNSLLLPALAIAISAPAQVPAAVGELFASESTPNGPLMQAGTGMAVVSGSELAAGRSTATLRLERGGEVKICPYSRLNVTSGSGNAALLFAMNASSAELSYPLNALTDTLITPDFRLTLTGPATYHFAVGVNSHGDTCIRPLRGNSGAITISELIGTGTYSLKPDEAVLLSGGKLSARGPLIAACGCPVVAPVIRAENRPPASVPAAAPPGKSPEAAHLSVEAPLVFRGDQPTQQAYSIAKVKFSALPDVFLLQEKVEPTVINQTDPPKKTKGHGERKGFFGAIRGFFASIFHRRATTGK